MRTPQRVALLLLCALIVALATPAVVHAATFRAGDTVVIGQDERIDDDLYATGGQVVVLGVVTGDVVASASSVEIGGNVGDDVMAAGGTVQITGDVGGSVRAAGGTLVVSGRVAEDVVAAGGTLTFTSGSSVERDLIGAGGQFTSAGDVIRNLTANGGAVAISGPVGGDARIDAENLAISQDATIDGDLSYSVTGRAEIDGSVRGTTTEREPEVDVDEKDAAKAAGAASGGFAGFLFFWAFVAWIRGFVGYLVFGLLVVLIFRGFTADGVTSLQARPWPALGWGALAVFVVPIAFVPAFLLGLLFGGWWIAVLAFTAWLTFILVGFIIGLTCIGRLIIARGDRHPHDVWSFLLGLGIVWVIYAIPGIGGLVYLGVLLFGTGGVILAIADRRRGRPGPGEHATPVGEGPPSPEPPIADAGAAPPGAGEPPPPPPAPQEPVAAPATAPEPPADDR